MKVEMLMPQMGESITEATVSKWLKQVGQAVTKDEIILEISTDKVDSEIPAPATGILSEIKVQETETVPVKAVIAIIDTEGSASAVSPAAPQKPAPTEKTSKEAPARAQAAPVCQSASAEAESSRFLSPLVKSLAQKHGLPLKDLEKIPGSGRDGRLTKEDILQHIERASAPRPSVPKPVAEAPKAPSLEWDSNGHKVIVMDNMRHLIAEHMVRSKQTSPHVYSIQEVDVSAISRYRAVHKNEFQAREGYNLSFTPFFLEAAVRGLVQFPHINSSIEGKKIILKKHINLGCAVALGNSGLIVPVIRNAEEKNLVGLARGLNDMATRARNKKLMPDEIRDGTFTVTNPGVFGTMIGTPIINQPQVAILCLGAIKKRPVVIDDMIAIREICYLTLSYDHRVIDGALGGQYLAFIREYLENWDMERKLY